MTRSDTALARAIAEEAGTLLQGIRSEGASGRETLGQRADAEANALILARLADARPQDQVLSEEARDDGGRCAHERVWIVDPLDGTREYAEGRDDWAVHIALAIGGRPRVGAVAVPGWSRTFVSDDPRPTRPPVPKRLRMVVSRTRPPAIALRVADALSAETIPMGSAGAKAMAVVSGQADIYLHDGGQSEWDSCAPVAVALAAGLHASRIDGTPLVYNRADVSLPDLLICRFELAERVLALTRTE